MAKKFNSNLRLTKHERDLLAQREIYLRSGNRDLSDKADALPMYTPERAARLASQSRKLWAEMRRLVDQLLRCFHSGGVSEEALGFCLRTVQIVIRGYSSEHREWMDARLWATPYGDRDGERGLFHFMNELQEIVEPRLKQLREAVVAFDKSPFSGPGDREDEFGPGFCEALESLGVVWKDWVALSGIFEQIDCGPNDREIITANLPRWDNDLAAIEQRSAARRRRTTVSPRKPAKVRSKRPTRRR